jgi:hypothetical protein
LLPGRVPVAALRVAAGLMQFRGVNADQPDLPIAGFQRVSVDYMKVSDRPR